MTHPYAAHREDKNSHERAKSHLKGYASGGMPSLGVMPPARGMAASKMPTKLAMPTIAEGVKSRPRLDRVPHARGGRTKKATTVNVVVNPTPAAPAAGPMLADGPPIMPPPGPPPGAPAMPMMPPKPPMGGGAPMPPPMMRARGGRAVIDDGAGSGEGRLEKVAAYGANAKIKNTTTAVKGPKGEGK